MLTVIRQRCVWTTVSELFIAMKTVHEIS